MKNVYDFIYNRNNYKLYEIIIYALVLIVLCIIVTIYFVI